MTEVSKVNGEFSFKVDGLDPRSLRSIVSGYFDLMKGRIEWGYELSTEEEETWSAAQELLGSLNEALRARTNKIVTITGPSLTGKTHLVAKLIETGHFTELVSHTTRPNRPGEVDGKAYYFVSEEGFYETEMAEAVTFGGYRYGLSVDEVERGFASGKIPVVVVEPQGKEQIALIAEKRGWDHHSVFITAPLEVRMKRFLERFRTEAHSDKVADNYATRLSTIFYQEESWGTRYDFDYTYGYSPETEKYTVGDIVEAVAGIQAAKTA